MASILEAQIDFLGLQVHLLPADRRDAEQIEQAMAVSLSFFDQIVASARDGMEEASSELFARWLQSAEAILAPSRDLKRAGKPLPLIQPFMRAILKARFAVGSRGALPADSSWVSLDEVERELPRGAE